MTNQKTDGPSLLPVAQCPEERDQPHRQASNGEHASDDREDRIHGDMVTATASASVISGPADEHHDAEEREAESEDHAATVTGDREAFEVQESAQSELSAAQSSKPEVSGDREKLIAEAEAKLNECDRIVGYFPYGSRLTWSGELSEHQARVAIEWLRGEGQ